MEIKRSIYKPTNPRILVNLPVKLTRMNPKVIGGAMGAPPHEVPSRRARARLLVRPLVRLLVMLARLLVRLLAILARLLVMLLVILLARLLGPPRGSREEFETSTLHLYFVEVDSRFSRNRSS